MARGPGRARRLAWRLLKWPLVFAFALLAMSCAPVAYIELACRGDEVTAAAVRAPLVTDAAWQRREANTFLTYPEWHIVYAYDGLAETLKHGDEYQFDYMSSVAGFWRSACALMRVADEHGGADSGTRVMIHTIGVSFTIEMALKALYEETLGRATAWLRGPEKTPQDQAVAAMAVNYSAFLRQTPWYAYPFTKEAGLLWAPPAGLRVRSWERRLAIGVEFLAKAAYGKLLGAAVAATEPATLQIRSVVAGMSREQLTAMPDVRVIDARGSGFEIETPRYDTFTRILASIARSGGTILEIAGNESIMVTITLPRDAEPSLKQGKVILRMARAGMPSDRLLVEVRIQDLAALLNDHPIADPGLEHVFDF